MTDQASETQPEVRKSSRFNKVWIIPIIALLLGAWLVKRNHDEKGDIVTIRFETADGLTAGKTEVKCRNVKVGIVEDIRLTDDLKVEVSVRIKPDQLDLVRKDSQFWVEKARVQGASISGLDTLIKGAFIGLDPGTGSRGIREFKGLETPPLTPASIEGLRLVLTAREPGSVTIGSGIYFQNNLIGRVESHTFHPESKTVEFGVFIQDSFSNLVTTNALFWQNSGISLHVGADGFDLDLPSLDSLVAGRISVAVPKGVPPGDLITDNSSIPLFQSLEAANQSNFMGGVEMLILIDESLRGLSVGSPVEYRGLKIGRVGRISYDLVKGADIEKIPVLLQLDDRLMAAHFPPSILDEGQGGLKKALLKGLKASLKSGNLLTGQMYVDLDYYPDSPTVAELAVEGDYVILPTIHTGLNGLQDKISNLLDKLNEMDLDGLIAKIQNTSDEATETLSSINLAMTSKKGVVADAQTTLQEMTATMKSINDLLDADDTKQIPADLRKTLASINESLKPLSNDGAIYGDLKRTMEELRHAVRSIDKMAGEISDKPNSLLFGKDPSSNKIPRARR
ncbi:MlaD family protein [Verrucomicrobiaceae bacterium 227]